MQPEAYKGPAVVEFLKYLLGRIAGKIHLVWDGAVIHRCGAVKEFLGSPEGQRLTLIRLPAYAPELNPVEPVWYLLKYTELKNLCCRDIDHLKEEITKGLARLRKRTTALLGCITHTHSYS